MLRPHNDFPLHQHHDLQKRENVGEEMEQIWGQTRTAIFLPDLLGTFIACLCMGIIFALAQRCLERVQAKWLKWVVGFVVLGQLIETSIDVSHQCDMLAINWGDPTALNHGNPWSIISPILGVLCQGQAQLYLLWRVWQFNNLHFLRTKPLFYRINYFFIALCGLTILSCVVCGTIASVGFHTNGVPSTMKLGSFWQYSALVIDFSLAIFLLAEIIFTRKQLNLPNRPRSRFRTSLSVNEIHADAETPKSTSPALTLLNRLISLLVASGLILLAVQGCASALWARDQNQSKVERWSMLPLTFSSKIYSISFLVILASSSLSPTPKPVAQEDMKERQSFPMDPRFAELSSNNAYSPWDPSASTLSYLTPGSSPLARTRTSSNEGKKNFGLGGLSTYMPPVQIPDLVRARNEPVMSPIVIPVSSPIIQSFPNSPTTLLPQSQSHVHQMSMITEVSETSTSEPERERLRIDTSVQEQRTRKMAERLKKKEGNGGSPPASDAGVSRSLSHRGSYRRNS